MKKINFKMFLLPLVFGGAVTYLSQDPRHAAAQSLVRFTGATSSQPLALSGDDSLLIVANPDNDSVTLFDAKNGNAKLAEIRDEHQRNRPRRHRDGHANPWRFGGATTRHIIARWRQPLARHTAHRGVRHSRLVGARGCGPR